MPDLKYQRRPASNRWHFDDSVESTADSDLEDGELQNADFTTVRPESFGETRSKG